MSFSSHFIQYLHFWSQNPQESTYPCMLSWWLCVSFIYSQWYIFTFLQKEKPSWNFKACSWQDSNASKLSRTQQMVALWLTRKVTPWFKYTSSKGTHVTRHKQKARSRTIVGQVMYTNRNWQYSWTKDCPMNLAALNSPSNCTLFINQCIVFHWNKWMKHNLNIKWLKLISHAILNPLNIIFPV